MPSQEKAEPDSDTFAGKILVWYGKQGRSFPWRNTRDPYRIWLSEIMLQQTGVATVIPYYQRFLQRFPTVTALAAATVEEVIALWAGLGYYSRARNLHAAAAVVVNRFNGLFPSEVKELSELPGVGRSTAGAIAALAFDKREPILDGNVKRILCRLFAFDQDPTTSVAQKQLWSWAEKLTPKIQVHDYTQAIMDLGATVCIPRNPKCALCPVRSLCRGFQQGLENKLPRRQQRNKVPTVVKAAIYLEAGGKVLVRRRPLHGLLGGLLEFPEQSVSEGESAEAAVSRVMSDLVGDGTIVKVGTVSHLYSHFRLELVVFRGTFTREPGVAEDGTSFWVERETLPAEPLHGAHKKMLRLLQKAAIEKKEGDYH